LMWEYLPKHLIWLSWPYGQENVNIATKCKMSQNEHIWSINLIMWKEALNMSFLKNVLDY
jgi:hypothetical protein